MEIINSFDELSSKNIMVEFITEELEIGRILRLLNGHCVFKLQRYKGKVSDFNFLDYRLDWWEVDNGEIISIDEPRRGTIYQLFCDLPDNPHITNWFSKPTNTYFTAKPEENIFNNTDKLIMLHNLTI